MQSVAGVIVSKYGLNKELFFATVECESKWKTDIQSANILSYGRERSFGIAQFHAPDNPDMTYKQMISPIRSLDLMAQEWQAGRAYRWSCYNILTKN